MVQHRCSPPLWWPWSRTSFHLFLAFELVSSRLGRGSNKKWVSATRHRLSFSTDTMSWTFYRQRPWTRRQTSRGQPSTIHWRAGPSGGGNCPTNPIFTTQAPDQFTNNKQQGRGRHFQVPAYFSYPGFSSQDTLTRPFPFHRHDHTFEHEDH